MGGRTGRVGHTLGLDALLLGVIALTPVLLYYALPTDLHSGLVLDYGSPTLLSLFTTSYLHRASASIHLWGNVAAFLMVVVPTWALHVARGRRRRFWTVMALTLFAFPALVTVGSYAWFAYVLNTQAVSSQGFSGIVSVTAGYLVMSIIYYVASLRDPRLVRSIAGTVIPLVVAAVLVVNTDAFLSALRSVQGPQLQGALVVSGVIAVGTATRTRAVDPGVLRSWRREQPVASGAVLLGTAAFVLVFVNAFPQSLVQDGAVVDVLAHGLGMWLGVLTATAAYVLDG